MAPVIFDYLREALGAVVAEGTGKQARIPGVAVGGKTGTAQTHEFRSDAERKRRDQDHAWFAGFAPLEEPQVVVVVFAEKAGLRRPGGRAHRARGSQGRVPREGRSARIRRDEGAQRARAAGRARGPRPRAAAPGEA